MTDSVNNDIHGLVRQNKLDAVKFLIFKSPEAILKPRIRTLESPLHIAIECGHYEMIEFLLLSRADLLAKTSTGWTPLHVASNKGDLKSMKTLLDAAEKRGLNIIDVADQMGNSPLLVTCIAGNLEALQLLLAEGANLALKNEIGDSALHLCCLWGRSDMVKYLLDSKISLINVREQNCLGNTPLHKACAKGYSEIATMLTLKGASLLAVNNEGQTPVDVSAPECIKRI